MPDLVEPAPMDWWVRTNRECVSIVMVLQGWVHPADRRTLAPMSRSGAWREN